MMIWNVRNLCRTLFVIDLDRIDSYTVVKGNSRSRFFYQRGCMKMIYGWTLGACLFLTLIVTAGCSHIGHDLVNVPPKRCAIG